MARAMSHVARQLFTDAGREIENACATRTA